MDRRRINVDATTLFYVRASDGSGGEYLTNRTKRTFGEGKYRWAKTSKSNATLMTYDAAQQAALRYGGEIIRREILTIDQPVNG